MNALASVCSEAHVVIGAHADLVQKELADLPLHLHFNENWVEGIGLSISCGVKAACAAHPEPDAIVLLLADQPLITAIAINRLVDAAASTGAPIVASAYQETLGVRRFLREASLRIYWLWRPMPEQSSSLCGVKRGAPCQSRRPPAISTLLKTMNRPDRPGETGSSCPAIERS